MASRRGRLPQLQELHPDAGEMTFEDLAMNKAWRRQSSADWAARAVKDFCAQNKVWNTEWRQLRAEFHETVTPTMSSSPSTSSRSPLQKTPWNGPWQSRQTTRTTCPCQTRRLSRSSLTCYRLQHPYLRCPTWSAVSLCAWCTALDRVDVSTKKNRHLHHITSCLSVVSRVRCLVCLCSVCPAQDPRQ